MQATKICLLVCVAWSILVMTLATVGYIDKATQRLEIPAACTAMPVDTIRKAVRVPKRGDPVCRTCGPDTMGAIPDSLRVR